MAEPSQTKTTRRDFLVLTCAVLDVLVALLLSIPLVGSCIGPAFHRIRRRFARVGKVGALPVGEPVELSYTDRELDAYLARSVAREVWVVKRDDGGVAVFSPICPHLGCRYEWLESAKHFYCPCHHSVFALDGTVVGGPAPRGLDTLPSEIEGDELRVRWQRFELGIPEKKVV